MSKRQTALITGALAGIGRELANVFAQNHCDLVVVSRSADKLQQLAQELEKAYKTKVVVISKDLMLPNAAQEVFAAVQEQQITIPC